MYLYRAIPARSSSYAKNFVTIVAKMASKRPRYAATSNERTITSNVKMTV